MSLAMLRLVAWEDFTRYNIEEKLNLLSEIIEQIYNITFPQILHSEYQELQFAIQRTVHLDIFL
jgi:hypothetical protein